MGWNGFAAQELRPDCDCELLQMAASQFSENVNSIFLPSHDCCCRALCVLLKKKEQIAAMLLRCLISPYLKY